MVMVKVRVSGSRMHLANDCPHKDKSVCLKEDTYRLLAWADLT